MTDEERQEQTLLALKVFHEGLEARGLLDDAQPHEVARLKRKIRQGDRAMQEIIELHTPLVQWMFDRYFQSSFWLREEMMVEGTSALYHAALTYNPDQGRDFGSWAFGFIKGAMLGVEGVANHPVTLSRRNQARFRKAQVVMKRLEAEGDGSQEVTPQEIAEEAQIPLDEVEALMGLGSLSLHGSHSQDSDLLLLDTLSIQDDDHLAAFASPTTDEEVLVEALLDTLKPEDAKLIIEVVMNEVPVTEMAERLGVTKQAVSQKVKRLLKKLSEEGVSL